MNCEEHQEKLSAFFDGERTEHSMGDSFAHLFGCPECQAFWHEIVDLRDMAGNNPVSYPDEVDRSIYGLQRHKRGHTSFEFHLRLPRFAFGTLVALMLTLAFVAGYIVSENTSQRTHTMQLPEYAMPARVVYIYAIPGPTVYADEQRRDSPRELKPEVHYKTTY